MTTGDGWDAGLAAVERLAAGEGGPETGVAAGATVALAARLVHAASEDGTLRAQAQALSGRARRLAAGNAAAHAAARDVLRARRARPAQEDVEVLREAGLVPLGIAATAADVAVLAAEAVPDAPARTLPDLVGAAELAAGAAAAVAGLVTGNLVLAADETLAETVRDDVRRAREAARDARAAANR